MHCPVSTDKYKYILPNQYSINAFFLLSRQSSPWYLKSLLDIAAHPVIFLSGQEIVSTKIKVVWPFDLITSCSKCVSSLRVIIKLRFSQISKKKCLFRAIQLVFGKGAYLKSLLLATLLIYSFYFSKDQFLLEICAFYFNSNQLSNDDFVCGGSQVLKRSSTSYIFPAFSRALNSSKFN